MSMAVMVKERVAAPDPLAVDDDMQTQSNMALELYLALAVVLQDYIAEIEFIEQSTTASTSQGIGTSVMMYSLVR
jgi:hypothetical protein